MKPEHIGWLVCLNGLIYLAIESAFFGSKFWPTSAEEVLADGIGTIICCIGLAVIAFSRCGSSKPK